jgi:tyrocidine synthetase-3
MKAPDKKNIEDILPLTPMQEGMLFHYLKDPGSEYYFEQLSLGISGEIDSQLFEKAWNFVIETNEMLRAVFRWEKVDNPVQIILKEHRLKPGYYDFSSMGVGEKKAHVEEIKTGDRKEKFDLREVPFRVTLCKLDEEKYDMIISNYHILYDGWSSGIILKEFFNAYDDLVEGKELQIPGKTRFKEYVKQIRNQDLNRQEIFWRSYLAGFEAQTGILIKHRREKDIPGAGNHRICLAQTLKIKIENFVKSHKITLASFFYTLWGLLLQKYRDTNDVIFGTTVSGRSVKVEGVENIVGLLINTLPLRIQTNSIEKAEDLIYRIDNDLQAREAYESTSLVNIREYSELSHNEELFDSIVIMENYPLDRRLMPGSSKLSIDSYSMVETTHYDLTLSIGLLDDIELVFIYNKRAFDKDTIMRVGNHFRHIAENILKNPVKEACHIEIILEEEKKQILAEFNNTNTDYPKDKTIHQLFEEQVKKIPDHIGAVEAHELHELHERYERRKLNIHITYREISRKSGQLAHLLRQKDVQPDTIVGIMVERSLEMIMGILGILKAGGAYLPIDPEYPEERINYMLKDSGAKLLVTTDNKEGEKVRSWEGEKILLELEEIPKSSKCSTHPLTFLPSYLQSPSNLAYVIYTSGSTGRPKGVMVEHVSAINILLALQYRYPLWESDVYLLKTSYVFDVSVAELFGWFPGGGRLAVLEKGGEKDPQKILDTIEHDGITHVNFVPSMFNAFVEKLNSQNVGKLSGLKYIFLAGEALLPGMVNKFRRLHTQVALENIYGPTEGTVYSSWYSLSQWSGMGRVPIGKPLQNVGLYILDKKDHLQMVGVPGELCISGIGLSRGYLNRPELTAEKFIEQRNSGLFLQKTAPGLMGKRGQKIYKSGDLARWLPDGNIEYLGRMDHQVKMRGFRIELGEIENRLVSYRKVKEALVVAKEIEGGDKYLGAYIVPAVTIETLLLVGELKEYLSRALPGYMIPTYFAIIDNIPWTPSGKVDRKALPAFVINSRQEYAAPQDEQENTLVDIWAEVLGIDKKQIGINDNFFDLGGHSLKVVGLMGRIHKKLNVEVPFNKIFQAPTVKDLAQYIRKKEKSQYSEIPPVEKKECYPISSAQKRLFLLQQMEAGCTAYNIHGIMKLAGPVDKQKIKDVFAQLITRHESLRTSIEMTAGELVQRIHEEVEFKIEWYDSGNRKEPMPEPIIESFIRSFDLSRAPLLRVGLVKLAENKHLLMVDIDHIISDDMSIQVLTKEFIALYGGEELPPLKLQYKDYSEWQNNREQKEAIKQQEKYWLQEFAGTVPLLDMPTDFARQAKLSFEGSSISFKINRHLLEKIRKLVSQSAVTLTIFLLSIYKILLSIYTGQEELIVGIVTAGRRHADIESIIGFFINMIPIRTRPGKNKRFSEYLLEVKEKALNAYENQDYQFEELVARLKIQRSPGRHPLIDTVFSFHETSNAPLETETWTHPVDYKFHNKISHFDLLLHAIPQNDHLNMNFEYSTRLFKKSFIEKFAQHYRELLEQAAENPEIYTNHFKISHQRIAATQNILEEDQEDFNF